MPLARPALVAALSLLGFAALPSAPAHATGGVSVCQTGSGANVSVTVYEGDPIKMSTGPNGEIELTRLLNGGGTSQCQVGPYLSPVPATTANTDYVTIGSPSNDPGDDVTIDLRKEGGGRGFVGAATSGTGLEATHFVMSGWVGHHLTIEGTDSADEIRALPNDALDLDGDGDADLGFSNGVPTSTTLLTINGNGGDDVIDLSPPTVGLTSGWPFAVHGGYGDDLLLGSGGSDTLDGGPGNDEIVGGQGTDTISGGDNDDTVRAARTLSAAAPAAVTIPSDGTPSLQAKAFVPYSDVTLAYGVRVHLNLSHPHPEHLQVVLEEPSGDSVTLADGSPAAAGSGPDVRAAVLTDGDTAFPGVATAPYSGTFAPASGTLLPPQGYAYAGGYWSLTVTDTVPGEGAGTVDGFDVELFGSSSVEAAAGTVDGGPGNDTLTYLATGTSRVFTSTSPTEGSVDDGSTWTGVEKLVGSSAADELTPSSGTDDIDGGPGDDTFHSSLGSDTLRCGDGSDTLLMDNAAPGVSVDLDTGGLVGTATHDGGTDSVILCENVVGTSGNDTLVGSAESNRLDGRAGNDTLDGEDGGDTLIDGSGTDTVDAGDGHDTILPWEDTSADTYTGGAGVDVIDYSVNTFDGVHVSLDDVANDGVSPYLDDVHSDIEAVTGTTSDDTIVGDAAANVLQGNAGKDAIAGRGGNDQLSGGGDAGDSVVFSQAPSGEAINLATGSASGGDGDDGIVIGFDTVFGSAYADTITGTGAAEVFRPNGGNDVVHGGGGTDTFVGGSAPDGADTWDSGDDGTGDTIDYSLRSTGVQLSKDGIANDGAPGEGDDIGAGHDVLWGGQGADTLIGTGDADVIRGEGGNDSINGRGGNDVLWGDTGNDAVNGGSGNDAVHGGEGADALLGGDGDDVLRGEDPGDVAWGADTLAGGNGDDDEFGGLGDDRFVEGDTAGPNGSDLLRGEGGTDTVSYNGRTSGVKVSLNGTYDDGATNEQDNASNDIEKAEGTAYGDTITGSSAANTLLGLGGNDVLNGLTGNDTVDGGTGNDTFLMGSAADGKDVYVGGAGTDLADYHLRTAALTVKLDSYATDGQSGELDWVKSDVENVYGGNGNDVLVGSSLANRILGYGGFDQIVGGLGADYLDGGAGSDWFFAKDGIKDTLVGGTGTDVLKSYDPTDVRSSIP